MNIAVIASEPGKQELLSKVQGLDPDISWHSELEGIDDVDAIIDLLFQPGADRISTLEKTGARIVVVNHVSGNLEPMPGHFIRINGWPGFLGGPLVEAAAKINEIKQDAEQLFTLFNKKLSWVPDQPGFVGARVIAAIINEAYLTFSENVSTREEIDTAMKLGTNYPYGPFEWANMIGISHIHELLISLSALDNRYRPAALLTKEALT